MPSSSRHLEVERNVDTLLIYPTPGEWPGLESVLAVHVGQTSIEFIAKVQGERVDIRLPCTCGLGGDEWIRARVEAMYDTVAAALAAAWPAQVEVASE